jgi:hypothetical protein
LLKFMTSRLEKLETNIKCIKFSTCLMISLIIISFIKEDEKNNLT